MSRRHGEHSGTMAQYCWHHPSTSRLLQAGAQNNCLITEQSYETSFIRHHHLERSKNSTGSAQSLRCADEFSQTEVALNFLKSIFFSLREEAFCFRNNVADEQQIHEILLRSDDDQFIRYRFEGRYAGSR